MTRADELRAIAVRVEIVHGGDRDMDAEICIALQYTGSGVPATVVELSVLGRGYIAGRFPNGLHSVETPALTSSLDAVEALREQMLPGSEYTISMANNCAAHVWLDHWTNLDHVGHAETAPRAFLAALLRALAGKEGDR